ncbi:MAG: hypothetical protein E7H33_09455 [Clostridium perfringens]|nr:hypothetical protein [Clostridium perfringens]
MQDLKKGFVYAVCGNTYNIKDELKAAGARWNKELKTWTFENEVANYKVKKINYEDITETSKVYNDSDVLRTMIDVVKLVKTRESIRNN